MQLGEEIKNYVTPPHPKSITIEGDLVVLEPLNAKRHAAELFAANALDEEGINWVYLPYGPFRSISDYTAWIKGVEAERDPAFFAIIRKRDNHSVGIASYLRINLADGSIEVGHIHFSPLLQKTTEATETMYLMMKWAFDNGYRRYEWKCNALNKRSRAAAQRLGLAYEGVFRQMTMQKGRNRDTAWFAAIDKEWKEIEERFVKYLSKENFDEEGKPILSLSSLTRPLLYKVDESS